MSLSRFLFPAIHHVIKSSNHRIIQIYQTHPNSTGSQCFSEQRNTDSMGLFRQSPDSKSRSGSGSGSRLNILARCVAEPTGRTVVAIMREHRGRRQSGGICLGKLDLFLLCFCQCFCFCLYLCLCFWFWFGFCNPTNHQRETATADRQWPYLAAHVCLGLPLHSSGRFQTNLIK
ncbi:hypothetical protein BCV70DRAFT_69938 [Testicularia cyperi]|uniref:Uncharacterized protein n=1 Tax=Testicularia cyperi TaxID=1882483 RepID=A0A317XFT7_9BASI|nr:hypothetical protein BCV70DRAFT_69938 [Testicularia cyperi]